MCTIISQNFDCAVFYCIRAWKNHLKGMHSDNQIAIYQTLCILLEEPDIAKFHQYIDHFIQIWSTKEPQFIDYFIQHYYNKSGQYMYVNFILNFM